MLGAKLIRKKQSNLRLCLDENFPAPVGDFLKKDRHNVTYSRQNNKQKALSDEAQIKNATKDNRILLTLDNDFFVHNGLKRLINRKSCGVILMESADPKKITLINIINKQRLSSSKILLK